MIIFFLKHIHKLFWLTDLDYSQKMCRKVSAQVTNLSLHWNWPRRDALNPGEFLTPLTTPWGWWFITTNKSKALCFAGSTGLTDAITKSRKNLGDLNVLSSLIFARADNLYDHSALLFTQSKLLFRCLPPGTCYLFFYSTSKKYF